MSSSSFLPISSFMIYLSFVLCQFLSKNIIFGCCPIFLSSFGFYFWCFFGCSGFTSSCCCFGNNVCVFFFLFWRLRATAPGPKPSLFAFIFWKCLVLFCFLKTPKDCFPLKPGHLCVFAQCLPWFVVFFFSVFLTVFVFPFFNLFYFLFLSVISRLSSFLCFLLSSFCNSVLFVGTMLTSYKTR